MFMRRRRTSDAKKERPFGQWKSFERDYERQLRKVSGEIRRILEAAKTDAELKLAEKRLGEYVKLLSPWADIQAESMVMRVYEANERRWGKYVKQYGFNLREAMTKGDIGQTVTKMIREAADYIKSLPLDEARRVGNIAKEAAMYGMRPEAIEERIKNEGNVTDSRARLIARTEVARANSILVQARAESLGSRAYIWQTAEDSRVRESHMEMNGKVCYWNDPPVLSDSTQTHPGQIFNCRCIALPLLSEAELEEALRKNPDQKEQTTRGRRMGYFEEPEIVEPEIAVPEPESVHEIIPSFNATTVKEANEQAVSAGIAKNANFKGLDVSVANEMNQGVLRAQESFPGLKGRMDFIGSMQEHNKFVSDLYSTRTKKVAPNVYAISRNMPRAAGISFNANKASPRLLARLTENLKREVEDKWSPQGCGSVKAIIDHEMGHEIHKLLDAHNDTEILSLYNKLKSSGEIKEMLPEYAGRNPKEFIAEAWAEYQNNPKPRETSVRVVKRLFELRDEKAK